MAKKNPKVKMMSEYETDLVWMSYRYAIGRHTIAASSMCHEMAKNVYGRLTRARSEFMAEDIQKEIADHLRFYPFSFCISYDIPPSDPLYVPIDRFIGWFLNYGYKDADVLENFSRIEYHYDKVKDIGHYETTKKKDKTGYTTSDWEDLMDWSNLAKLLNYKCHKYCLCKDPETGEETMVEYFESYRRKSYKTMEFEKVKIPCEKFHENSYVFTYIDERYILKDEMTSKEVMDFAYEHKIENPFHLDKSK